MTKLWLKFKDENGGDNRVEVAASPFTIGRHSACDLSVPDSRLSREHLRIERDGDRFSAIDLGSSNGTTLDGRKLDSARELADGSVLDLGGGLELKAELESSVDSASASDNAAYEAHGSVAVLAAESGPPSYTVSSPSSSDPVGSLSEGIPTSFFFIAPLLAIFVLAAVVGAIVLFGGGKKEPAAARDTEYSAVDEEDSSPGDDDADSKPASPRPPVASSSPADSGPVTVSSPLPSGTGQAQTGEQSEIARIQQSGAVFIRQMAQNDPNAFLTGEQANQVAAKVKQLRGSSAVGDNLNSARRSAAAIREIAKQRNLKPQFLAIAAITKLGNTRGDVLQSAQTVADIYDKLSVQLGGSTFDDALLMVAAYEQGVAGETMKMRDMLVNLAGKPGAPGPRELRTVWFLKAQGKLTGTDYDRVLAFLALGTLAQNPKEFGVNAEALKL